MPVNWFNRITASGFDIDVVETLSSILAKKKEFTIRRIPDVSHPSFFVLSASIVLFYVTIEETLKLFAVMEKQPSPRPFITSSRFNSKHITFRLDKKILGDCISKEEVAWDINMPPGNQKLCEVIINSNGLSCKILQGTDFDELVGKMEWEPYWTESDMNVVNPNDLPPNASYSVSFDDINLESQTKSLILVSSFAVHYSQKRIQPKRCTQKTVIIIFVAIFFLVLTIVSLIIYFVKL